MIIKKIKEIKQKIIISLSEIFGLIKRFWYKIRITFLMIVIVILLILILIMKLKILLLK